MIKVLFIGDIVGSVGRQAVQTVLPRLKQKYHPDFIIANGENTAGGKGITEKNANELFEMGIDGLTMGNHTWDKKEIFDWIDSEKRMVRPANFPTDTPGRGWTKLVANGKSIIIVNLQGRTFLPPLDCPFQKIDEILEELKDESCILIDFHAEATSEKIAMGWHVDGRVSALVGTHTHVQTHDQRILPAKTAYVTDVGMVGAMDGVLGMEREAVLYKFKTQLPARFESAKGAWHFHGVLLHLNEQTGHAESIDLIRLDEEKLIFL